MHFQFKTCLSHEILPVCDRISFGTLHLHYSSDTHLVCSLHDFIVQHIQINTGILSWNKWPPLKLCYILLIPELSYPLYPREASESLERALLIKFRSSDQLDSRKALSNPNQIPYLSPVLSFLIPTSSFPLQSINLFCFHYMVGNSLLCSLELIITSTRNCLFSSFN